LADDRLRYRRPGRRLADPPPPRTTGRFPRRVRRVGGRRPGAAAARAGRAAGTVRRPAAERATRLGGARSGRLGRVAAAHRPEPERELGMNDEDAFHDAMDDLIGFPGGPPPGAAAELRSLRLVFADWLDERGRPAEAHAHRWQAAGGRRPEPFFDPDRLFVESARGWRWACAENEMTWRVPRPRVFRGPGTGRSRLDR